MGEVVGISFSLSSEFFFYSSEVALCSEAGVAPKRDRGSEFYRIHIVVIVLHMQLSPPVSNTDLYSSFNVMGMI